MGLPLILPQSTSTLWGSEGDKGHDAFANWVPYRRSISPKRLLEMTNGISSLYSLSSSHDLFLCSCAAPNAGFSYGFSAKDELLSYIQVSDQCAPYLAGSRFFARYVQQNTYKLPGYSSTPGFCSMLGPLSFLCSPASGYCRCSWYSLCPPFCKSCLSSSKVPCWFSRIRFMICML